ncbi:hypothetical protein KY290_027907 [Solanum tuberosum]|uniref:Retrotransposon gag domain-containing protein n=1 Tax=Solanum tuberosum TaxID=4113 RepID=A0ABQ7UJK9_SOLTU|nr:hypothetical protein KY290_027907 [Solanum tuberosum]
MATELVNPYTHPLNLHPSDASESRRSMRIALLAKRKLDFVTGICKKASFKAKYHDQWDTCNAIVLSWIMNTVAPSLLSGIVYASDASFVWEDLQERFDKVNRVRIYQLHREIATIAQGTDAVSVYFTKLKELWAEYDTMVVFPSCECPKSKDCAEHLR